MSRHNDLIEVLGKNTILCSNLGFGEQGSILSKLSKGIYICPDIDKARHMKSQLDALSCNNVLIDDFSKPFTLSKFQSNENKIDLLKTIYKLCFSNPIIISTVDILFSFLPNLNTFKTNVLNFQKGDEYSIEEIERKLISIGYKKVEGVTSCGEFSRRGDILDIYNVIDEHPIRLDFFDTSLDNIFAFDFLTFEKKNVLQKAEIVPNKIFMLDNIEKENIIEQLNLLKTESPIVFDILNAFDRDDDIPLEFLYPFSTNISTFSNLNYPIIISNPIQFETLYKCCCTFPWFRWRSAFCCSCS